MYIYVQDLVALPFFPCHWCYKSIPLLKSGCWNSSTVRFAFASSCQFLASHFSKQGPTDRIRKLVWTKSFRIKWYASVEKDECILLAACKRLITPPQFVFENTFTQFPYVYIVDTRTVRAFEIFGVQVSLLYVTISLSLNPSEFRAWIPTCDLNAELSTEITSTRTKILSDRTVLMIHFYSKNEIGNFL